jgi:4-amino-4-deoxy-L-arabinose transferase-like glycosyltransferase
MKIDRITKNPYLLFSPFIIIYIYYILIVRSDFSGDEIRYLRFADHLIHGYYSPPAPDLDLTNGPGYPILIAPFVAAKSPLILIALLNAVFYYLSIILLFKALRKTVREGVALAFSLFWACYYIAFQGMNSILTETFTFLLISLLIFALVEVFKTPESNKTRKYIWLAGLTMGYIALTKVIFGYVLIIMLIVFFIFWLANIKNVSLKKGIYVILIAFLTVSPYLVYTYHMTGRIFYWGFGKDSLYWMTTPYNGEYGDWKGELSTGTFSNDNYNIPGSDDTLKAHHGKDFEEFTRYRGMERDDAFKRAAMNNLKSHPLKYVQNVVYNMGRLVFHYPFSYSVQRTKVLLVFPINGIVFTLILYSLIPTILNWRKINCLFWFLLLFCFSYLGLSSLVSAQVRMFTIVVPILFFWFASIIDRSMVFKFKFDNKSDSDAGIQTP